MPQRETKGVFLDVDSSIVENNLRITNESEEEFSKLFGNQNNDYPSKLIKPHPGLCVKTRELETCIKVFVNICTTDAIPSPKDITEAELEEIIETDETGNFRVPMSIGEIRPVKDLKGNDAKAVDIAINPAFFKKVQGSQPFKNFFMAVVFQGLENKYGLHCTDDKVILANKKAYGTLQMHRIQQREIDEKMGKLSGNTSALSDLTGEKEAPKKVVIETLSSVEHSTRQPEYRLYKKVGGPNSLFGEFKFPDIISISELTLDVGEDRILIESKSKMYLLDIFVPYCIRNGKVTASFDKALKILTVVMPLIGG